jgi:4-amino-4-deoxy-L-arabinose transferase-like glycosyltransferase
MTSPGESPPPDRTRRTSLPLKVVFGLLVALQLYFSFQGLNQSWTRGHNGWGGAAYNLSARNTLRWDVLFPLEYDTSASPPEPGELYTHHPLALHLHTTASVWLFGDEPWAVRLVPAVHGVLATIMLLVFVRRFWGDRHAALAGALYVLFPINAIYANMSMHSLGFIFWALAMFHCYLHFLSPHVRARWKWAIGLFACFFMASSWDWPAYYVAFILALHWFGVGLKRQREQGRPLWRFGVENQVLVLFCVFVLALFFGHFALVYWVVGGLEELLRTFSSRQQVPWPRFIDHLEVVPALMFTVPVLVLGGLWLLALPVRAWMGRWQARDIVPVCFAFAGVLHFFLFKQSAIQHSYWAWTANPFLALANASVVLGLGRRIAEWAQPWLARRFSVGVARRASLAAGACAGLLLLPLMIRVVEIVPEGRRVGGSMWFVAPGVRGAGTDDYDSGRPELAFADRVREWTNRQTGVMIHASFRKLRPEYRFFTVMDREYVWRRSLRERGPSRPGVTDGWVFIGLVGRFTHDRLVQEAAEHPYRQFGRYFMIDYRTEGRDVRIWTLDRAPMTAWWWFFHSRHERPLEAGRHPEAEQTMRERIAELQHASAE